MAFEHLACVESRTCPTIDKFNRYADRDGVEHLGLEFMQGYCRERRQAVIDAAQRESVDLDTFLDGLPPNSACPIYTAKGLEMSGINLST